MPPGRAPRKRRACPPSRAIASTIGARSTPGDPLAQVALDVLLAFPPHGTLARLPAPVPPRTARFPELRRSAQPRVMAVLDPASSRAVCRRFEFFARGRGVGVSPAAPRRALAHARIWSTGRRPERSRKCSATSRTTPSHDACHDRRVQRAGNRRGPCEQSKVVLPTTRVPSRCSITGVGGLPVLTSASSDPARDFLYHTRDTGAPSLG